MSDDNSGYGYSGSTPKEQGSNSKLALVCVFAFLIGYYLILKQLPTDMEVDLPFVGVVHFGWFNGLMLPTALVGALVIFVYVYLKKKRVGENRR